MMHRQGHPRLFRVIMRRRVGKRTLSAVGQARMMSWGADARRFKCEEVERILILLGHRSKSREMIDERDAMA